MSTYADYRPSFETFKSNLCHLVKDLGDIAFLIKTLEKNEITDLWDKKWYPECFYMLAMVDYLSRINNIPICSRYDGIRKAKLAETVYPTGIMILSALTNNDEPKRNSLEKAIPEFMRFNIAENEVRNVC